MNLNELRRLSSGFQQSRIILTAAEVGLFDKIGCSKKDAHTLARMCDCDKRGMSCILDALCAIGILSKKNGRYSIPPSLRVLLLSDSPATIIPIFKHSANMWQRWSNLTDIVRNGRYPERNSHPENFKMDFESFVGAMHAIGMKTADSVVKHCKIPTSARKLLDIGGALGTYSIAFLKKYSFLNATIFDRPEVIALAQNKLVNSKYASKISFCAGDFDFDDLPEGYDVAVLSAIIHQNSQFENRSLFEKVYKILRPKGILIIRDYVMNEDRTKPPLGALFAVNMLVATGGGGTYTFKEIKEDILNAGFKSAKLVKTGDTMDAIVMVKKD